MITIKSFDGGEFDGYLALPASGYGPGIVVIQEIFGVNSYMRSVADWYAAHGFVALCPDLFWRMERGVQLTDKGDDWNKAIEFYQKIDEDKAVEDSAAALEFLRRSSACNGRVGAVGFCMGGNLAYLLSTRFKPDCAVGYYGVSIEKSLDEAKNLSQPIAACTSPSRINSVRLKRRLKFTTRSIEIRSSRFTITRVWITRLDVRAVSITTLPPQNSRIFAVSNSLSRISPAPVSRAHNKLSPRAGTIT